MAPCGPITLVALDQGSAFYAKVPPAGNAMTPPDNDFCRCGEKFQAH